MRNYLSCHDKVVSSSTRRLYVCIVPPGNNSLNCHSPNVVYLLTCSNCKLQYVGDTALKISERFNWHRSCFKYPAHYGFCKRLSNHFSEGLCKNANYSVQIIEKLEGIQLIMDSVTDSLIILARDSVKMPIIVFKSLKS